MFRSVSLILLLCLAGDALAFRGRVLNVTLDEQTQFVLKVVPNLGTRLIFPFLLDDAELRPPLNYKLINTANFAVTRSVDNLAGQNVFLITAFGAEGEIGKLYMSIAGYNLAINLIVSRKVPDHISDIYLDLSQQERDFLISNRIDNAKKQLQRDYEQRAALRQTLLNRQDLAALMVRGVKKKRIKQLFRGGKNGFKTADIYLDDFLYLPRAFYGLHFWVEHYGKKFTLLSLVLRAAHPSGAETAIEGHLFCFNAGPKLDECIYISKDDNLIHRRARLHITLTADNNEVHRLFY